MCNLTFVYNEAGLDNTSIRMWQVLSTLNSQKNPDGFGYITSNNLTPEKTTLPPLFNGVRNLGRPAWIMSHVRKKSSSVGWKKDDLKLEETHPFVEEGCILFHNGTMGFKDYSGMDSAHIARLMSGEIAAGRSVEAATEYMVSQSKWGTYSLMLYNNIEEVPYVIKAHRDLYYTTDIRGNLWINTDRDTLQIMFEVAATYVDDLFYDQIKALDVGIYQLPNLAKVGTPYKTPTQYPGKSHSRKSTEGVPGAVAKNPPKTKKVIVADDEQDLMTLLESWSTEEWRNLLLSAVMMGERFGKVAAVKRVVKMFSLPVKDFTSILCKLNFRSGPVDLVEAFGL